MGKDSFILYDSDLKGFEFLTENQAGKLFKALIKFRLEGTKPNLGNNAAVNILFNQITEHIAINESKYKATCAKRSEAMKKRWGNDKKSIEEDSILYSTIEKGSTLGDNDNENDIDNDIVIDNVRDACGAKKQNKRNNYYGKNTPRLLRDEPTYDIDAFTRQAIGLKYEKKAPQGAVP